MTNRGLLAAKIQFVLQNAFRGAELGKGRRVLDTTESAREFDRCILEPDARQQTVLALCVGPEVSFSKEIHTGTASNQVRKTSPITAKAVGGRETSELRATGLKAGGQAG